jgi:hypothetical protein
MPVEEVSAERNEETTPLDFLHRGQELRTMA